MSPSLPCARKKLSYPLYGADFDPLNQDFLLVGGGGGSTSSGVPNKISLIDTSRHSELNEVTDIELAKNEDSVTSLAVAESNESSLTAYAGINSSIEDQNAGRNEHFRSFRIGLPARKRKADGDEKGASKKKATTAISSQALKRLAIFRSAAGPKNDTYQRVLRLSPAGKDSRSRIAAIASGLAPDNEIIVFRANSSPATGDEMSRISLGTTEAADLDLAGPGEDGQGYALAYCMDDEVFVQSIPKVGSSSRRAPVSLYKTPAGASSTKSKFRALRYLTQRHILTLRNRPGRTGVDLVVLKTSKDNSQAQITIQKRLNTSMKAAVGLDVCPLSESASGQRQFIVAVAGQDSSIELLTIDFTPESGLSTFRTYIILREVHSGPITKMTFSNFIPPPHPITKDVKPQSVRLASVGVDQTVVVHTLPLRPISLTSMKTPRYVLHTPGRSETIQTTFSVFIALVVVTFAALLMQAFCEIRGAVPSTLGATDWLSPRAKEMIARPYIFANGPLSRSTIDPAAVTSAVRDAVIEPLASSIPAVPSIEEVQSLMADIPTLEEIQSSLSDLPSVEDVRSSIPDIPSVDEVKATIPDIPSADEIRSKIPNVPLVDEIQASISDTKDSLVDLITENSNLDTPKAILLRADPDSGSLKTELLHDAEVIQHATAKKWDEMTECQKHGWRQKLRDAGHWTEQQGENVLKGILFSEIGAMAAG